MPVQVLFCTCTVPDKFCINHYTALYCIDFHDTRARLCVSVSISVCGHVCVGVCVPMPATEPGLYRGIGKTYLTRKVQIIHCIMPMETSIVNVFLIARSFRLYYFITFSGIQRVSSSPRWSTTPLSIPVALSLNCLRHLAPKYNLKTTPTPHLK